MVFSMLGSGALGVSGLGFGVWVAFHSLGFAFEVSCCES